MQDLDSAIVKLPSAHATTTVTKWTALALKARAALYEGTFRRYHGIDGGDEYLALAADAAETLIDEGGYKLYTAGDTPYRDLFASTEVRTDEVILARIYNLTNLASIYSNIQYSITNEVYCFSKSFMNHYLCSDGTYFSSKPGYDTMVYTEEVKDRDPRMAQTVLCPGYVQKGETEVATVDLSKVVTGYKPIKFVMESSMDANKKGEQYWPCFRIAEAYLVFAEAKAELGTITQDDLDKSVNLLRRRVGMPDMNLAQANANPDSYLKSIYPNVTFSDNTGVILEIRRERTVELVMEGFRRWDLLRWKEGKRMVMADTPYLGMYIEGEGTYDFDGDGTDDTAIYATTKPDGYATTYQLSKLSLTGGTKGNMVHSLTSTYRWNEERDYLWPVPAEQRILTQGKLSQNPGWDDGLSF